MKNTPCFHLIVTENGSSRLDDVSLPSWDFALVREWAEQRSGPGKEVEVVNPENGEIVLTA